MPLGGMERRDNYMKQGSFIAPYTSLLICLLVLLGACKEVDDVPPVMETFLDEVVAIDQQDRIILYNGNEVSSSQDVLFLDGDEITVTEVVDSLALGSPYRSAWRDNSYTLYKTELPILKIRTATASIVEEDYEPSQITLIEQGQITLQSNLGIRLRGNTSLSFPKKSYRLELWEDETGSSNRNESILGMRSDDDWLLDGMWNEPLSIRDKSAMELWLSFGRIQPASATSRTILGANREYCELFIDGLYRGVYYLGERLDEKQLQIDRDSDPSLAGELYKAKNWDEAVIGFSLPPFDNTSPNWGGYEVKYPEETGSYDWGKLKALIEFFNNQPDSDFETQYPQTIDLENIIDYFLLINVLDAFDNSGNNIYIARKNQALPYYFVSWDFDATAGLGIFGQENPPTNGFVHHLVTRRLIGSPSFQSELKLRWADLRADVLSDESVKAFYRANYATLVNNGIYQREAGITRLEKRLPGENDLDYLENSLENRLQILDKAIEAL